jgi:subtilase family serine protease
MTCLTPYTIRQAYDVESLTEQGWTGKGQTVIDVVSFGSPTLQQDMNVYDQTFSLPPVNLQIVSPLHEPQSGSQKDIGGWAGETTLDVQIIHSIAPDAKIVVLTSPVAETEGTIGLPEFRQLVQYAIDNKLGSIFSQSWGASELTLQDQASQQELQKWDSLFQKATTQQGATFFSSSGDEGATDYADLNAQQVAHVQTTSFAPDSPWVTAVGGTTVHSLSGTFTEQAWGTGDGASGGGFSRFYSTPSYQKTLPAAAQQTMQNRRGVPDVAADADPSTGLAIYVDGQWTMAGGTSAAAPVWAGIMAIANQRAGHPLGFINPALYKLAAGSSYSQDFNDITAGNNAYTPTHVQGYNAAPGWDPVTGLGTPKADKLIPDLIAAMK